MIESRLNALEMRLEQRKPPMVVTFADGHKCACSAAGAVVLVLAGNTVDRVASERGGSGKLPDLLTAIARL